MTKENTETIEKPKAKKKTAQIVDDEKIIEEAYEEYKNNTGGALVKDSEFSSQLSKIEEQLAAIVEKQKTGVSAEFNALMDGYVNKANESQEFKVKSTHVEGLYEELKIEHKTTVEENKKLKADLEATKEALRMSESDIKRFKEESDITKAGLQKQILEHKEERENLKDKLRDIQKQFDESVSNYNNIKSELLEQRYKVKQLDQEKTAENEAFDRTQREATKLVDELKEKLELRTREVEYKDALLNQVIKQVSVEDSGAMPTEELASQEFTHSSSEPQSFFSEEQKEEPKKLFHQSLKETISSKFSSNKKPEPEKKPKASTSWGPFKRK